MAVFTSSLKYTTINRKATTIKIGFSGLMDQTNSPLLTSIINSTGMCGYKLEYLWFCRWSEAADMEHQTLEIRLHSCSII